MFLSVLSDTPIINGKSKKNLVANQRAQPKLVADVLPTPIPTHGFLKPTKGT